MFSQYILIPLVALQATSWMVSASVLPKPDQQPELMQDSRINKHLDHFMAKVDDKLEESMQLNFPLLSDAMYLNGTSFQKGLFSALGSFKSGLLTRMRADIVSIAQEIQSTRQASPKFQRSTFEEKTLYAEKLNKKWEASMAAELKSWSTDHLTGWLHSAQDIWHGVENQVKANLLKLKEFLSRHNPLRKPV